MGGWVGKKDLLKCQNYIQDEMREINTAVGESIMNKEDCRCLKSQTFFNEIRFHGLIFSGSVMTELIFLLYVMIIKELITM